MSCQRVQEIDLTGFLASPRDAEFASFREHYPMCRECAAEVRAWTELEIVLRGPAEHPAPELLLRFEDEPMTLAAERRAEVDRHLAGCASCRDELSSLRAFQPAASTAPVREHALPGLGELLAALRRWLWQPALAYALVLLLLVPLVADRWGALEEAALEPAAPALGKSLALGDRKRDLERADADEQRMAEAPAPELERLLLAEEAREPEPAPALHRAAGAKAPAKKRAITAAGGAAGAFREQKNEQPASAPAPSRAGRRQQPAEADAVSRLEVEGRVKARSRVAYNRAADELGLASDAPANVLPLEPEGDDVLIDVPVPTLSGDANEIEVRVIHADGRRQLVELVEARTGSTARIRVPHGWLTPGLHRVEVRVPSDPPAAARVFEYTVVSP